MKRKGQEEIVGFVLIVVIIAIVFVIFLGIKLRNPEPIQKESEILYQFIESSMEQTTDCVLSSGRNEIMNELIKECYSLDNTCSSGKKACTEVKDTFEAMVNNTWQVGPNYKYKGYEINIDYNSNSSGQTQRDEIASIVKGNCNNTFIGNSYWIPQYPGRIEVKAKLCS